jgi:tRNA-specific 2-thiouridylase
MSSVAIGLSGGVDSAVAAHTLIKQGYDVTAVFLQCWKQPDCRAEQDRKDALKIALDLDIPFKVLDFRDEYRQQVLNYFLKSYQQGLTPNPDVLCNQVIKFGLFYDWALENKFDSIATGHYAQIIQQNNQNPPFLATSQDLHKDQTYFLHQLEQKQLQHIKFPIGNLTKDEVRQKAQDYDIHVANKKDSVGICFIGNINVRQFLEENLGQNPGEVVNKEGSVIGQHQGLWFYTIGQRRGFSINKNWVEERTNLIESGQDLPPLYVLDKKIESNQLVVGPRRKTAKTQFEVKKLNLINHSLDFKALPLKVRIRHTGQLADAEVEELNNSQYQVSLKRPLKGIAPGQFAVLYTPAESLLTDTRLAKYICLGGGTITK